MTFLTLNIFNDVSDSISVNPLNILEVRAVEALQGKFVIQLTMVSGNYYLLNTTGAPYATLALAKAAIPTFLSTF